MTGRYPLPSGPLDPHTAATVDLVGHDWRADNDYARFVAAVLACAAEDGLVSQNLVRAALSNDHGLTIRPGVYSAFWRRARRESWLSWDPEDPDGWDINDDRRSGNAGKPQHRYRLVRPGLNVLHAARVKNTRRVTLDYLPQSQRRGSSPPDGRHTWLRATGAAFHSRTATVTLDGLKLTGPTLIDVCDLAARWVVNINTVTIVCRRGTPEGLADTVGRHLQNQSSRRRCDDYTIVLG